MRWCRRNQRCTCHWEIKGGRTRVIFIEFLQKQETEHKRDKWMSWRCETKQCWRYDWIHLILWSNHLHTNTTLTTVETGSMGTGLQVVLSHDSRYDTLLNTSELESFEVHMARVLQDGVGTMQLCCSVLNMCRFRRGEMSGCEKSGPVF